MKENEKRLRAEVERLKAENDDLRAELAAEKRAAERAERDSDWQFGCAQVLRGQVEMLCAALVQAQEQMERLRTEIERLRAERDEARAEVERLRAELDGYGTGDE